MGFIKFVFKILPKSVRQAISFKVSMYYDKKSTKVLQVKRTPLRQEQVNNCKFISSRVALLELLPKNANVAQIGIRDDQLTSDILRISMPKYFRLLTTNHADIDFKNIDYVNSFSIENLKKLDDDCFDWVYLDSESNYQVMQLELEILSRKIKKGGIICGNKYTMGIWKQWIRYYTVEAVNTFCTDNGFEFIYFVQAPGMIYSYALKKIDGE